MKCIGKPPPAATAMSIEAGSDTSSPHALQGAAQASIERAPQQLELDGFDQRSVGASSDDTLPHLRHRAWRWAFAAYSCRRVTSNVEGAAVELPNSSGRCEVAEATTKLTRSDLAVTA